MRASSPRAEKPSFCLFIGSSLVFPLSTTGRWDVVHKGSCHCGAVQFEVEGDIQGAIMCNCSICHRKGAPLWFVPRDKLRFTKGEQSLRDYMFNKHVIKHR